MGESSPKALASTMRRCGCDFNVNGSISTAMAPPESRPEGANHTRLFSTKRDPGSPKWYRVLRAYTNPAAVPWLPVPTFTRPHAECANKNPPSNTDAQYDGGSTDGADDGGVSGAAADDGTITVDTVSRWADVENTAMPSSRRYDASWAR